MTFLNTILVWTAIISTAFTVVTFGYVMIRGRSKRVVRSLAVASCSLGLLPAASLIWTLSTDSDPLLGSGANWARNHGFGGVVDQIELWAYSKPPSTIPAESLDLLQPTPVSTTIAPPSTTSSAPLRQDIGESTTTTTTVAPFSPDPLIPVISPTLDGEGEWLPVSTPEPDAKLWVTAIRPLIDYPSVTATVVVLDPSDLRFALHNGYELPGGTWETGPRLETSIESQAIAAFNGGFRFEHIAGGYFTEGVEVEPLVEGEATFAIDESGELHVGVWGRDITPSTKWVSVRQSLPPIVDGGENMVAGTWAELWGVDHGNVTFVFRSAICEGPSGELIYAVAGDVDGNLMAEVMISLGCEVAMQLDINGNWPQFAIVNREEDNKVKLSLIDRRMSNEYRYLDGSKKDFVGVYLGGD